MDCVSKGVDFKNKTIGSYLILDFDRIHTCPSGQYKKYWKVQCIHCKAVKSLSIQHVIHSHQQGCNECKKDRFYGPKHGNWNKENCQFVTGMYYGKIKRAAENRNYEFKITREQMDAQFIKQDKRCIYTGFDLCFSKSNFLGNASLDRINSDIGYTVGNIQWVHKDVNHMKMDLSHERFLEICKLITENNFGNSKKRK